MTDDLSERLLPLEGGINFRDMGGHEAMDGKRVKWRHLYRSGAMHKLTDADHDHLAERGIRTVIDFRSSAEQSENPNHWGKGLGEAYWSRDHSEVFGNMHSMAEKGIATVADAVAIMEGGYRHLPEQQSEAYAEMFRRLAAGNVPAVIHCTAGKDRTGGGAALILAALGVPREAIIADFTMTERAVDLQKALASPNRKPDPRYEHYTRLDPEVRMVFARAKPSFITAFLDTVDQQWGSIEGYIGDLGLAPSDIGAIRASLLD